jgi:hypothetical protein
MQRLLIFVVAAVLGVAGSSHAQNTNSQSEYEPFLSLGRNWALDPVVLEAGTQVFFDVGVDDPGELELFSDGKLGIKLDLVGIDMAWMNPRRNFRTGFNISTGITTTAATVPLAEEEARQGGTAFVLSAVYFAEFGRLLKWQVGVMNGWGATEDLSSRDDLAVVVGFGFSTGLGQRLVGIFKNPDDSTP